MGFQASARQGEGDEAGRSLKIGDRTRQTREQSRSGKGSSIHHGAEPCPGNLEAERLAGEVYEQHEKLVRAERRTDLLSGLSKSDTSLAQAEAILDQVKPLRPEEDPESAATIKVWVSGMATVRATTAEAEEICKSIERELANVSGEQPPPHSRLDSNGRFLRPAPKSTIF